MVTSDTDARERACYFIDILIRGWARAHASGDQRLAYDLAMVLTDSDRVHVARYPMLPVIYRWRDRIAHQYAAAS